MATNVTIGGDDSGDLFADEDKIFILEVLTLAPGEEPSASSVPTDITGWPIVFDVRKRDDSADPALLSIAATITGTYSATRSVNTQRAQVVVTDDDMHQFKGSNLPDGREKTYRHSWKRTTAGSETVLCRGDFAPEKATAP